MNIDIHYITQMGPHILEGLTTIKWCFGQPPKKEVDRWVLGIYWVAPLPRMPVANEGLVLYSLLKMVHRPGGNCYWEGGLTQAKDHEKKFLKVGRWLSEGITQGIYSCSW